MLVTKRRLASPGRALQYVPVESVRNDAHKARGSVTIHGLCVGLRGEKRR